MTTSRGCPFKCAYCSANVLNEGRKVWTREFAGSYEEVRRRFLNDGIREFCFYEDNLLLGSRNFLALLQQIANDRDLKGIELFAPEGIEVRLLPVVGIEAKLASAQSITGCVFRTNKVRKACASLAYHKSVESHRRGVMILHGTEHT